jgi:hypothetical protein
MGTAHLERSRTIVESQFSHNGGPMGERSATDRNAWLGLVLTLVIAASPSLGAQSGQRFGKAVKAADQTDKAQSPARESEATREESPPAPKPGGLRMSRAVVCKTIDGFEDYKPLPGAAQTSDEKLLIYYRPLRYKIDFVDGYYCAHLVQDNEIRKHGRKEIVRQKRKVVEYDPKSKDPLGPIYMRNTISLKGLEPGDYDLTIILRDERDKEAPPTRQVVPFKVIPAYDPRTKQAPTKVQAPSQEP